jgi:hypothetical protein
MLTLFQRVFPSGIGHFELFPRVVSPQAGGLSSFTLFTAMIHNVRELGHNPEDVRLGTLFLEGKKG